MTTSCLGRTVKQQAACGRAWDSSSAGDAGSRVAKCVSNTRWSQARAAYSCQSRTGCPGRSWFFVFFCAAIGVRGFPTSCLSLMRPTSCYGRSGKSVRPRWSCACAGCCGSGASEAEAGTRYSLEQRGGQRLARPPRPQWSRWH